MIDLTRQDVQDLVDGAAILGTGGGGDPERGAEILLEDLQAGRRLRLTALEELVAEEGVLIVPYLVGTIAQSTTQQRGVGDLIRTAIHTFEQELGQHVIGTVATEVGGLNSAMAFHAAAQAGIPTLDGDVVGRAAPETCHTVLNLADIPLVPAVVAVRPGDVRVFRERMSPERYESTIRGLSESTGGYVAVVDSPCRPRELQDLLVLGTMTRSLALGRARRAAVDQGKSPIEEVRQALGGKVLFQGSIANADLQNEGGFLRGTVALSGTGDFQGQSFESTIINEHILGRRQGAPVVLPPDCLAFLDGAGRAIMNNALERGRQVRVLAWKAPAQWRTPKGLELFGPRHFGLDLDYVPVETLADF